MKKPSNKNLLPATTLRVRDYPWGCIYTGTRIQVIAADLVSLQDWPSFPKDQLTFRGHCEIGGTRRGVMIERDYCPTDTQAGEVWVKYSGEERDPTARVTQALDELARLHAEALRVVAAIKPMPLSEILGIGAERLPASTEDEAPTDER